MSKEKGKKTESAAPQGSEPEARATGDVQVEVTDDAVTIRGERRQEHEERREGYFQSERSCGSFFRGIPLPEGVAADPADASFHDGVLEVTMPAPRRETSRGRRLEVKG